MAAERAVLLLVSVSNEGAGPTLLVSGTAAAAQGFVGEALRRLQWAAASGNANGSQKVLAARLVEQTL
jgi:hypothetical protein